MASSLPIGDFSRATHMSIKTLRHYHRVGLLEPSDVDQFTGHRRYTTQQIPTAQVIRRFRELDMPIDQIRSILTAPDVKSRNELIAAHLYRLEEGLARTQNAVASLRDLLDHPRDPAQAGISHRSVAATRAAAVTAVIDIEDASSWYQGALGELQATISAQALTASGAPGGIYSPGLFTNERGHATVFIPCAGREPCHRPRQSPSANSGIKITGGGEMWLPSRTRRARTAPSLIA
jgi:DNA-binding transcriptional MerR regulator